MDVAHRKARRRVMALVDETDLGVDIAKAATAATHLHMPQALGEQFAPWPPHELD